MNVANSLNFLHYKRNREREREREREKERERERGREGGIERRRRISYIEMK